MAPAQEGPKGRISVVFPDHQHQEKSPPASSSLAATSILARPFVQAQKAQILREALTLPPYICRRLETLQNEMILLASYVTPSANIPCTCNPRHPSPRLGPAWTAANKKGGRHIQEQLNGNEEASQTCPIVRMMDALHAQQKPLRPKLLSEDDLMFVNNRIRAAVYSGDRSIDSSSRSLKDFCDTLRTLVQMEHATLKEYYEMYTQYDIPVIRNKTETSAAAAEAAAAAAGSHVPVFSSAHCIIAGLADARPSPHTGDVCVVRPTRKFSLLVPSNRRAVGGHPWHHSQQQWTGPSHLVEIHSQIMAVSNRSGRVDMTWLEAVDPFHRNFLLSFPDQRFVIQFEPSTKALERVLLAVRWLLEMVDQTGVDATTTTTAASSFLELLFPTQAPILLPPFTKERRPSFSKLNTKQAQFVDMVLRRTDHASYDSFRPPMILTGPAGTGKTTALLESILHILPMDKRGTKGDTEEENEIHILICTPSHTAADVICKRLAKYLSPGRLLRLYDADRDIASVPVELLRYCHQSKFTGQFCLAPLKEYLQYQVVVCTCSDAAILVGSGLTNEYLRTRRECLAYSLERLLEPAGLKSGVNLGYNNDYPTAWTKPHWTHLFMDEAAQATEAETILALSVVVDPTSTKATRKVEIALVGDPRQLSPNVYCTAAAEAGLGRSFLERLLQRPVQCLGGGQLDMLGPETLGGDNLYLYQESLSVFLTQNYRGHEAFLMMPSALFYFDKLQCATPPSPDDEFWVRQKIILEEAAGWTTIVPDGDGVLSPDELSGEQIPECMKVRKKSEWPILFYGVQGHDKSTSVESMATSSSWQNADEAHAVVKCVQTLVGKGGVTTNRIGIMAPFRSQVVLLRQLLRKAQLQVDVGTVEDYQAVERDVIILSCTRSNPSLVSYDVEKRVGMLRQEKRTNVALTRAERFLVVVGNPDTLWTCDSDIWKQWLMFCYRNGLWYGCAGNVKERLLSMLRHGPPMIVSHRVAQRFQFAQSGTKPSTTSDGDAEDSTVIIGTLELRRRST